MPKPGPAAENHRKKKLVDMSSDGGGGDSQWRRPPPEECDDPIECRIDPGGGDMTKDRVIVEMTHHLITRELVRFVVVQQTMQRGRWRTVAEVDSSHDDDVHVHWWSKARDERTGRKEVLAPVAGPADIAIGYDLAYERIVKNWAANKRRWHDA